MNKVLQTLANDLIASLRYLEKGKASTVTQEREKSLQSILKIFEMKMELNKKIVDGIFFACLNLFAEKELIESELKLLLQVQLKLFETYSGKDYFLEKANENNNLIAFLVKLTLPHINSESKEIASISSLVLIEVAKYLDVQRLQNIYPSLCSGYFKLILDFNPKTSKKCLIQAVDFLLYSFQKIFSDTKYKSTKNVVSLEKKVHDLTLSLFTESAKENKNSMSQPFDKDEDIFYQEARKIINSFFSVLSEKVYKLPKSAELTQKFVDLFDFILNKCIKFFQLQEKANFMRAFNCLLYFFALSDSETTQKHTFEILKLYPNLKYEIKSSQLKLIKDTPKLLKEVETKYFISHFKRLNLGFEILNTQDFITYTSTEVSDILKALQSAFHLNFKGQIIVNDSSLELDYENLKNKPLTQDYLAESFHQYNSAFTRFILEYLPVSNFDEEVFRTSRKMFSLVKGSLATNLIENLYSSLIENKFSNIEEVLTVVFLLSLLLEHSQDNGIQTSSLLEFFLDNPLKNIELPKTLKAKEQKLLIDQLTTTIVYFAYQRIQAKSPILTSRVLIFLFCRFHQDHRLQRFLVWNCLIKISKASFDEARTFEDFIKFYSETLIRNFIDKLKMIHLLYDPELPFNLLKAFIWFSDSESFLKYAENLISHLNRHFDKFYLREDFRTIKLIFPLYKAIFEAIDTEFTRNTEKAQKMLKNSNLVRRALLRIKPFILENDRHLCHFSVEILKISCFALSCLPMEREQANENFSPDDPENVVISESLGPIAWEFFDTIVFRLKKKGHPATIFECLQYLRTIQKYNKRFLINERRFETHIFPIIQSYLFSVKKEYYNNLELRILEIFCSIIIDLDLTDQEANKHFITQIKSIVNETHKILETIEDNNMKEQLKKIIDTLDRVFTK